MTDEPVNEADSPNPGGIMSPASVKAAGEFPILRSTCRLLPTLPTAVPWDFVAPHQKRAHRNHSQTLERLAERGGLSWSELWHVLEDKELQGRILMRPQQEVEVVATEALAALNVIIKLRGWQQPIQEHTK